MSSERSFKFCILAAGRGTRNTAFQGLHKALFPVANKPVISIILEKVPKEVPVVVAIGHLGSQVKSYLEDVHDDRVFEFVNVKNYSGPGSGPGLSLLECEKNIQCPFIFTSADTIIDEDFKFKSVEKNWIGVSQVSDDDSHEYCLVKTDGQRVVDFYYGENQNSHAFTGIAGVRDYKQFWEGLRKENLIKGEHQVLNGLRSLDSLETLGMVWLDTGNDKSYNKTKAYYPNDLVIEKNNEAIFVDNGKVIKYFDSSQKSKMRVERSIHLDGCAPKVTEINDNMFSYRFHKGKRLSDVYEENTLRSFLQDYYNKFAVNRSEKTEKFLSDCDKMYRQKTLSRVKSFSESQLDKIKTINGVETPPVMSLIRQINWEKIANNSIPCLFHGDLQPENILSLPDKSFLYIDWRESFGNDVKIGDLYYDLGKLYHALIISNSLVMEGNYEVQIDVENSKAEIYYAVKSNLIQLNEMLSDFCAEKNLDYTHVKFLGILNYLNIAGLYGNFQKGSYGKFLFLLGKKMLSQLIQEGEK